VCVCVCVCVFHVRFISVLYGLTSLSCYWRNCQMCSCWFVVFLCLLCAHYYRRC